MAREYWFDLVYQLMKPPLSWSNRLSSVDSLKALLPTTCTSRMRADSPSVTVNVRFTRLRSMGVTVVTTFALYRLRLTYWRLSSCSARSARALSYGRPSARPISRSAFCSAALSNSLAPTKSTSAMVGRSSTITTSTLPLTSMRTSLNNPRSNSARIAAEPRSSL
ncbi:hypothetical protein D3C72_1398550 [compost metagenome]